MQIAVEEVLELQRRRKEINSIDLEYIEFTLACGSYKRGSIQRHFRWEKS